ncbi:hypothetical protein ACOSP7_014382 [Xanthoceras sorbifolium]
MNIKATSTKQQDHVHKPKDKLQGVSLRQPQAQGNPQRFSKFIPTCHYCGVNGHIRPRYYKYISMCKNG